MRTRENLLSVSLRERAVALDRRVMGKNYDRPAGSMGMWGFLAIVAVLSFGQVSGALVAGGDAGLATAWFSGGGLWLAVFFVTLRLVRSRDR